MPKREPYQPPKPEGPPYDQAMANQAAAIDHALKLGGVILSPKGSKGPGFGDG